MKQALSVVIITLNEERNIARCLESIQGLAEEVVVVDSFSSDRTCEIAESYGARVVKQEFLGHIQQKNFAIDQAKGPIILSLDADEALSPQLHSSIQHVLDRFEADGYTMNRLNNYCGKWIRYSGWYPDTKLRLFKKGQGAWTGTNPHDRYALNHGLKSSWLQGDILHYSFYSTEQHDKQIESFTSIAAKAKHAKGIKSSWWKIWLKPVAKFLRNYVLKLGFLDGYYGWVIATKSAYATYLRYRKLKELTHQT
jgi:glycosyltransferase involved in cell wall biosynthesis